MSTTVTIHGDNGVTTTLYGVEVTLNREESLDDEPIYGPGKLRGLSSTIDFEVRGIAPRHHDLYDLVMGGWPARPYAEPLSPLDRHLADSWYLRHLPGTAAYGTALGGALRGGEVITFTTDREKRFAERKLNGRGMSLRALNSPLQYRVIDPWERNQYAFLAEQRVLDRPDPFGFLSAGSGA